MRINETLEICLRALDSRYPHHTLHWNGDVVRLQGIKKRGETAEEVIACLEKNSAQLLEQPASLIIDASHCVIHLPLSSREQPALQICLHEEMVAGCCNSIVWS